MLQSLTLNNIALIEQLQISFHAGFHVLSGETGAGKSIVVDAVNLALGGRADRDLIRTGCEKASVEAVFDMPGNEAVTELLARESVEYDGRTVTVYREISVSGKNICRICGVLMPVSFLKELAALLMDIHGQHDHRFLMDPAMHLSFLDQMGDESFQQLRGEVSTRCGEFLTVHRAYARLVRKNETRTVRMKELEGELKLLRQANWKPGEEERLQEARDQMKADEKISLFLRDAYQLLAAGELEAGCMEKIRDAAKALQALEAYGEPFRSLAQRCDSLYYTLEDISYEVHRLMDQRESDPMRLEKTEKRLELIQRVRMKYGDRPEEAQAAAARLQAEYEELQDLDRLITEKAEEHKRALSAYRKAARELTERRRAAAASFESAMTQELRDLGMSATVFEVQFAQRESRKPLMPRETGDDELEFMLSPNPGEPVKPLARTASGGELSRIMLAMKTLEAGHTGVESMVFDEIDTGISGRMAQVVAEKMKRISQTRQVICVTHLPQIAAAADYEYAVRKEVRGERTYTVVTELDQAGRVAEIARLISGARGITAEAERYAENLLRGSEA